MTLQNGAERRANDAGACQKIDEWLTQSETRFVHGDVTWW